MFLRLRQRLIAWLRDSDKYDDRGRDQRNEVLKENNLASGFASGWRGIQTKKSSRPLVVQDDDDALTITRRSIHFTVFPGRGGIAIQTRQYDEHTDDNVTTIHIVPENDDLATAIANIITLQSLR